VVSELNDTDWFYRAIEFNFQVFHSRFARRRTCPGYSMVIGLILLGVCRYAQGQTLAFASITAVLAVCQFGAGCRWLSVG